MPSRKDAFDRLIAATHNVGLEPDAWSRVIEQAARLVDAPSGVLFSPIPGLQEPLLAASNAQWTASLAAYESHWMQHDPWLLAAQRDKRFFAAGETTVGTDLVSRAAYRKTPFYNEFGRPGGLASMLALRLADGRGGSLAPVTMISFQRGDEADEFDAAEKEALAACWPHLRRGLESHWAFRRARRFHGAVEGALDAMAQPVWVLRADATIDHANARAQALMSGAPWIAVAGRCLMRIGDLDVTALRQAIAPDSGAADRTLTAAFVDGARLRQAVLRAAPLQGSQAYAAAWPHAQALLALELPPEPDPASWLRRLAAHHRLTPAEQRVLERLAVGSTLDDIGGELHVSRNTVRTHLRALFDKFGVRRQADLVRLALGG